MTATRSVTVTPASLRVLHELLRDGAHTTVIADRLGLRLRHRPLAPQRALPRHRHPRPLRPRRRRHARPDPRLHRTTGRSGMNGVIVQRIRTDNGSHIEPPCDDQWSDLDRLRWHLAVVLHDAKLPPDMATIEPGDYRIDGIPQPDAYNINYRALSGQLGGCWTTSGFHHTWTLLNGITLGFQIAHGSGR